MNTIVLIGAGNLAYHLAIKLSKEFKNDVHKRSKKITVINHQENKITLALKKQAIEVKVGFNEIPKSDLYIICVKDNLIQQIAEKLKNKVNKNSFVVHTSGAIESKVLSKFENYGVFYPLHSFSFANKIISWKNIPVFYIANNQKNKNKLKQISKLLTEKNYATDDKQKRYIHLMAVFANNFTNALMHAIYKIEKQIKNKEIKSSILDFAIHTIQLTENKNPAELQTGPAIRYDNITIEKHLKHLNKYPEIKQLYLSVTHYIQNAIGNEK